MVASIGKVCESIVQMLKQYDCAIPATLVARCIDISEQKMEESLKELIQIGIVERKNNGIKLVRK